MDKETITHYLTAPGMVFNKKLLLDDIGDRGFAVNGIDLWICNDINLIISTIDDLKNETFEIRYETDSYLGYIDGESIIYLLINPIKSKFNTPLEFRPEYPTIPNLVRVNDGKVDFSHHDPPSRKDISSFSKVIIIIENFNYLDQDVQRFIANLSLQVLFPVVAQINYSDDAMIANLIPDYERYMTSCLGLISDNEYERLDYDKKTL